MPVLKVTRGRKPLRTKTLRISIAMGQNKSSVFRPGIDPLGEAVECSMQTSQSHSITRRPNKARKPAQIVLHAKPESGLGLRDHLPLYQDVFWPETVLDPLGTQFP